MTKEYLILATDKQDIREKVKALGISYAEITSRINKNLSYYFLDTTSEKAKELYDKGAELVGKISELPYVFNSFKHRPAEAFSEFKKRFGDSLDSLLIREDLPTTNAVRHRVLLCSSGYGPTLEDLSKRDSFITSVYSALAKLSVSKA